MIKKYIITVLDRISQSIIDALSAKIIQNREILQALIANIENLSIQMVVSKEELANQLAAGTTQTHQIVFEHANSLSKRIDTLDRKLHQAQVDLTAVRADLVRFHLAWQHSVMGQERNMRLRRLKEIYRLLPIHEVKDVPMKRLGRRGDGGYIMLDDFTENQIAYSFGISDDVSWDIDALANGIKDVYMYDHTIDGLPENKEGFHWFKTGITGIYDAKIPELRTLEQLLKDNGHENQINMLLKMDVEGAEWDVLNHSNSGTLNRFSQIVLELHNVNSFEMYPKIIRALQLLNKTHVPINLHGNNWEGYEYGDKFSIPDALEITYVHKIKYAQNLQRCVKFFPSDVNEPNSDNFSEIIMGVWGK